MIPKVKIAQILIDRLQKIKEEHCGWVYGTVYGDSQYIFGIFKENERKNGDIHFPANMDLCGAFQIGDVDLEVAKRLFKDVDVTDNPVLIQIPLLGSPNIYHFINNKLEIIEMVMVPEQIMCTEFVYVRLRAQIPLQTLLEHKSLQEEMLNIRKKFSAGKIAFRSPNSDLYLLGSNENTSYEENIDGKTSVRDFILNLSEKDIRNKGVQKLTEELQLNLLNMDLYTRATLEPTDEEILHAPYINIEKIDSTALQMILNVDGMAIIHRDTSLAKLYTILVECACRNIRLFMDFISEYLDENDNQISYNFSPEIVHFYPRKVGHFVSRVVNAHTADSAEVEKRTLFHNNFLLLKNKPYFRRTNRYMFDKASDTTRRVNPHVNLPPSTNGGELALVQGNYEYFHYSQDNMDDDGWGCAYRSFQTLASWFKQQGFCERPVPTFKEIQKCLYDIGDKPANFVGSKQWIGSTEVSFVLESLLGVTSKILYVSSGEEMASKGPELVYHFNKYGTPIMIGGGVLAHTILGVDYNRNTGDIMFLILDPHYKGKDDIKTIISKGWCGWKGANFWDKKSYYNMCMPQVTECI